MNSHESISSPLLINEIKLRFLNNDDIGDLKRLCTDWFPIV